MTLTEIALKNLLRRKGKAVFILAGLVIGVATVVGIISFVNAMTADINHKLEKYGANILIVPRTDNLALTYGGLTLGGVSYEMHELRETDLMKIESIKNARNVAAVGPMVLGAVQVKGNRILLAGVDFSAIGILKPWWRICGEVPDRETVVLGAEAARVLDVHTGQHMEIEGQTVRVSGILDTTGSQDDQLIFMPLHGAQNLLHKPGVVSMVEVAALCGACPIHEMVKQISEVLPAANVMAIQQVVKGRMETLAQFKRFSYFISAIIAFIGGLVVFVTLMGSVRERTGEIGIFRAIGFRKSHLMRIIFLEAGILSGLAGFMGYGIGYGLTRLGFQGIMSHGGTAVPLDIRLFLAALGMAMTVGLLASAYPALMASRMDPSEALRSM